MTIAWHVMQRQADFAPFDDATFDVEGALESVALTWLRTHGRQKTWPHDDN